MGKNTKQSINPTYVNITAKNVANDINIPKRPRIKKKYIISTDEI